MATRIPIAAAKIGNENQVVVRQAGKKIGANGAGITTTTAAATASIKTGLLSKQTTMRKRAVLGDLSNKNAKSTNNSNKVTKKRTSGSRAKSTLATASSANGTTTAATAIAAAAKLNALNEKKVNVEKRAPAATAPGIKSNVPRTQPAAKPAETKQKPAATTTTDEEKAVVKSTTVVQEKKEVVVIEDKVTAEPASSSTTKSEPETKKSEQTEVDSKDASPPPWAALDAEDVDDPLMVAEYADDIFEYMLELETKTMPNPRYMSQQKELQWNMRGILVDWLIDVHNRFQLLPETLFLTVNLIDRFLSLRVVSLVKLQLVGITSMFIASKYEEVMAPSIQNFIYMADDGYKEEEVLRAERYMLQTIDFNLSTPNPLNFLRRISKADDYDVQTRTVAKYLMEIPLVDHRLIDQPWSKIAAAAMYLARKMLNRGAWDANLEHYSFYKEKELLDIVEIMQDYLSGSVKHESLYKKYGDAKYFKASRYVREWVRQNVTSNGLA